MVGGDGEVQGWAVGGEEGVGAAEGDGAAMFHARRWLQRLRQAHAALPVVGPVLALGAGAGVLVHLQRMCSCRHMLRQGGGVGGLQSAARGEGRGGTALWLRTIVQCMHCAERAFKRGRGQRLARTACNGGGVRQRRST